MLLVHVGRVRRTPGEIEAGRRLKETALRDFGPRPEAMPEQRLRFPTLRTQLHPSVPARLEADDPGIRRRCRALPLGGRLSG